MKAIGLALVLLVASSALAESDPEWNAIVVRFTIGDDGTLHVTEQVQVDVPPEVQRLERIYWTDAEQNVRFDSITLYDGDRTVPLTRSSDLDHAHHFRESDWPGKVEWSVRDKAEQPTGIRSLTYLIESRVSDAVIPAWSIPRGRLTHANFGELGDPRRRLRAIVPIWREALDNPRHRYLVDYQFEMPPPSTKGTQIQLQIYWPPGWNPVHEITPDTVARPIERDTYNPDQWRVMHLFDEDGRKPLTGIDVRHHAIRMAALIGFPLIAVLFWIGFVAREFLRRPRGGDDEQIVREVVFREHPEVIQARWSGHVPYVDIEPFLRRLEKENKVAISLENNEEGEPHVSLRLLVPREKLTPYELAGIQALIPEEWETTSEEVRQRHEGQEFSPSDALTTHLTSIANASKKSSSAPWYSRLTSLAIFAAGVVLAFQETLRFHREPAILFGGLIVCSMLVTMWPDTISKMAVRSSLKWSLLLLIPLLLLTAILVFAHFVADLPPTFYGSVGFALMVLAAYKAILAASATHDTPDVAQLVRARRWLRNELRSATPRLRDDDIPWLNALGLQFAIARWKRRNQTPESRFATSRWTGNAPASADEEWGAAFMTGDFDAGA